MLIYIEIKLLQCINKEETDQSASLRPILTHVNRLSVSQEEYKDFKLPGDVNMCAGVFGGE